MRKSDIYEITIKILGLYLFLTIIVSLRQSVQFLYILNFAEYSPEQIANYKIMPEIIVFISHLIIVTALAFLFTFKTKIIVRIVCVSTDYEEEASLLADKKSIFEIAIIIVGLMSIIWALPDFLNKLQHHIRLVQLNAPTNDFDTNYLITSGLEILIGIILIYFRKPISSYLSRNSQKDLEK
jgi:hypothetical protein